MRRLSLWLVAMVVLLGVASPVEANAPKKRPLLLWKVEKDGAVSHVLGTCHVAIAVDDALPKPHNALLDTARVLIREVDSGAMDPVEALRSMWNVEGVSLLDELGEQDFRALAARMPTVPASMLTRLRPWGAWSMLLVPTAPPPTTDVAASPAKVLDEALGDRFQDQGARVYLESLGEQVQMMGDYDEQFLEGLRPGQNPTSSGPAMPGEADAVLDACSTGDLTGLEVVLTKHGEEPFSKHMLADRNEAWMPRLLPELITGGALVAVGTAHMPGEHGLLRLLQAEGFTVTRLEGRAPAAFDADRNTFLRVPPAPSAPEGTANRWEQTLSPLMAPNACGPANPLSACIATDVAACESTFKRDLKACLLQMEHRLPGPGVAFGEALATEVATCALSGMLFDQLVKERDLLSDACLPVVDQMRAAMPGKRQAALGP